MSKETEISRRGFSKLLGGLIGSSVAPSTQGGHQVEDSVNPSEAGEYRIVDVNNYSDMSFPYDVEVQVEYGEPGEDVKKNRFLFNEDSLENSELDISSDLLNYARSKGIRAKERHLDIGREIFQEHFNGDLAENHFARAIGQTLEIERALGIESIREFDKSVKKLNNSAGIEYKDGEFVKNSYSQTVNKWLSTGW